MDDQQAGVDTLMTHVKPIILQLLNETLDELEARELTDAQKSIVSDFSGIFGQKVLGLRMLITPDKEQDEKLTKTPSK